MCGRDMHAHCPRAKRIARRAPQKTAVSVVVARMLLHRLGGRRCSRSSLLQCVACRCGQTCHAEHVCSAGPRVAYRCRHVCLCLWSVASAVGTRTGAMPRCILAVYTSYKQYLTVRTRERPPVRVPCAICENRLTSANLGLDPANTSQ